MNLLMEPVSALPAESPALQRCAMRQIVEAYCGIIPSSGFGGMCQRPGYPEDRPCTTERRFADTACHCVIAHPCPSTGANPLIN
jgi:hypothetical protein